MIIGVTGPAGAGKDTAAEYLHKILNVPHISGGDILRGMLTAAGLEPKKTAIGDFGTFVRTHYGTDAILNEVVQRAQDSPHIILSGFRSPLETQLIKQKDGIIFYIDTTADLRYERIAKRMRSNDDATIASLRKQDKQEFSSTDPMAENLNSVKQMADAVVINEGTLSEFYVKLDALIEQFSLKG